jgi:hypothetical protein
MNTGRPTDKTENTNVGLKRMSYVSTMPVHAEDKGDTEPLIVGK